MDLRRESGSGAPDVCLAGAGIIGLSLALELERCGLKVLVLERGEPMAESSTAAAGMLAAKDPENPAELQALADLSASIYPEFLARVEELSGMAVPFQTRSTLQGVRAEASMKTLAGEEIAALLFQLVPGSHRFVHLEERSIDPRQLAAALLAAVCRSGSIELLTGTPVLAVREGTAGVEVKTHSGKVAAGSFVDCCGTWAGALSPLPYMTVRPVKGQMLSVELPASLPLKLTVRTPEIYVVPRLRGPQAGRAIVGATVEDVGFDKIVHAEDIASLHQAAAELLPELAEARVIESWAGLRPGTPDGLPVLGRHPEASGHLVAGGHLRNGILLAPATARVLREVILGEDPSVDLTAFAPGRRPEIAQPFR